MNEQIGKIHRKMNSIKNQMNILKTKAIMSEINSISLNGLNSRLEMREERFREL